MKWLDQCEEDGIGIRVLNVTGPRESKSRGIQERSFVWMMEALGELEDRYILGTSRGSGSNV